MYIVRRSARGGWTWTTRRVLLGACLATIVLAAGVALGAHPNTAAQDARRKTIAFYGGPTSFLLAQGLDVSELMGKSLDTRGGLFASSQTFGSRRVAEHRPARSANNAAIRDLPNVSENEPTVVANPRDPKRLVAGTHFFGETARRCLAHHSSDGGKTWNMGLIFMPQLTSQSECSDPVLAYAPDGSRVYYAYMDIKFARDTTFEIVLSYSDDDGKSWTGPIVALSKPTADYDKPWIGTHVPVGRVSDDDDDDDEDGSNSNWVYVSATRFDFAGGCHVDFARSSNKGKMWSAPQSLDSAVCGTDDTTTVVQGSRPTGGRGNDVLVAWYHSGADGWLEGSFEIRTRYSSNNGATFDPVVTATSDTSETPFWLGPVAPIAKYHRWWTVMFPDLEIAPDGSAHILYTHDPVAGSATDEDGDIRYVGSAAAPYVGWSLPIRVNDDATPGKSQGFATLEATTRGRTTVLHAIWEDHRNSVEEDNLYYDVFSSRRSRSGAWAPNKKLTDARSTSDFLFVGDYYDLTVSDGLVYGVWTDRRDEPSEFNFDDDSWGAVIGRSDDGDDGDDGDDD
jgi:hypothetical protein